MIRPQWTLRIVIRVRDNRWHDQSSGTQIGADRDPGVNAPGGVMVVEGRAGLGKTAMLDAACALVSEPAAPLRVSSTGGVVGDYLGECGHYPDENGANPRVI